MNLKNKKTMASKVLGVGKERIVFLKSRLDDIKEAITRQDIRDLKEEGAVIIKDIKGRTKKNKKGRRRTDGKVRKRVKNRKREYVILTRKLRKSVAELKRKKLISNEGAKILRNKIRNREFRSYSHMKEHIRSLEK